MNAMRAIFGVMRRLGGLWLGLVVLWAGTAAAAIPPGKGDFTLLWWAHGPQHYLDKKTPVPEAILCMQSGTVGLMLDTQTLRARYGRFSQTLGMAEALEKGPDLVQRLPEEILKLTVRRDGRSFSCTGRGAMPKDEFLFPIRFIESGRFLQRVSIEGLEFADPTGARLNATGRVEIAFWPHHIVIGAELGGTFENGELTVAFAGSESTVALTKGRRATLALPVAEAVRPEVQIRDGASAVWDPGVGAYTVRLADRPWKNSLNTYYPSDELDRLDRWGFTVTNAADREASVAVMFIQDQPRAVTGFTPMLCDPDGIPSGLPVQVSKNWHSRLEKGRLPHDGGWFHGCAFLRVPARSQIDLIFAITYARWGGVPAASHAQLCLIGWGHNQFWEEAAIGSFGESICYEPGRVQRRCFIDDVRPFTTLPRQKDKIYGWAANGGGGDFLMWIDADGRYRDCRATRTDWRAHGPCLTDLAYTEETAGGELVCRMGASIARSDDYLRAFHRIRYEVRRESTWRRLAFYQLGADFYNEPASRRVAVGDARGMREEWTPVQGNGVYDRRAVPLTGAAPWASIHQFDRDVLREGQAIVSRGLIVRSWRGILGGKPSSVPHVGTYATEWGKGNFKTVVELVPPPGVDRLLPGDYLEAELEMVMFPAETNAYYGPSEAFRRTLAQDADTWRLVHREAKGNALELSAQRGVVEGVYPLRIAVDSKQGAEFKVRGGLGFVPITFTRLTRHRDYQLQIDGKPFSQAIHGDDFWQTDYDPASKTWRMTFNVSMDGGEKEFRFLRK